MNTVLSVSQLNLNARLLLENHLGNIRVEGEISNLMIARSGHMYFTLKDDHAGVRCAFFKGANSRLNFTPTDGMNVIVSAKASLYAQRGDYQLIISNLEEQGDGKLKAAFEKLKSNLEQQGWFDEALKKPIPSVPKTIGVVTSSKGAAIRDILAVLKRRFAAIPIIVYPTDVQGIQAAPHICAALQLADARQECDVLLLARGGGSLEDLFAFNTLEVATAMKNCAIPIITGVGHEVDTTIADYVSDLRAATPSAAAEKASLDATALRQQFKALQQQLRQTIFYTLNNLEKHIQHLSKRLIHPQQLINQQYQHLDHLTLRLINAIKQQLNNAEQNVKQLHLQCLHAHPKHWIARNNERMLHLKQLLISNIHQTLHQQTMEFKNLASRLHSASPLAALQRGYSIVQDEQGNIVHSVKQIKTQQIVSIKVSDGVFEAEVK